MRTSDCDILIIPGYENSGPDHWQTRWERQLSTARRVEQASWDAPRRSEWVARIVTEVKRARRPVVLVAHSLGVPAVAHAAPQLKGSQVRGAFLVGLPDVENPALIPDVELDFGPLPRDPLPFPSVLVASRNDPFCAYREGGGHRLCLGLRDRRRRRFRPPQHRQRARALARRADAVRRLPETSLSPGRSAREFFRRMKPSGPLGAASSQANGSVRESSGNMTKSSCALHAGVSRQGRSLCSRFAKGDPS